MGRPSEYSPENAWEICLRLASGESLRQICEGPNGIVERTTERRWRREHPEYAVAFLIATRVASELALDPASTEQTRKVEARRRFGAALDDANLKPDERGVQPIASLLLDLQQLSTEIPPAISRLRHAKGGEGARKMAQFTISTLQNTAEKLRARISMSDVQEITNYDGVFATELIKWLERGFSIEELRHWDPSSPTMETVHRWRDEVPEFGEAYDRVAYKGGWVPPGGYAEVLRRRGEDPGPWLEQQERERRARERRREK